MLDNKIIISLIGFIGLLIFQYFEDKRLNVKRKLFWNKIKLPLFVSLIIYLLLTFLNLNCTEEVDNYEIFTNLPSF